MPNYFLLIERQPPSTSASSATSLDVCLEPGNFMMWKNHRLHSLPLFVVRNSKHPKSKQTDMYKITFCLKNNMSTVKCEKWNPGCRKSQVMMYDTLITCILITRFHRINSIINESYNSCFEAMNVAIIVVRHKAYIGQAPSSAKDHFCWGVRCTVPRDA